MFPIDVVLPDLRAAALDLAFSVDTAGSGLDESVPRLLAEAAAAGSAPAPGTMYVSKLHAVVLDATAGSDVGIDVVSSEYAVIAAEQTALERLAGEVADRVVTRLALMGRAAGEASGE